MPQPPRSDWHEAEQLLRAARNGDLAEVKRLVQGGYAMDFMDDTSKGALHYAVQGEHYKIAQWLLENGADANLHDADRIGETPLSLAAQGDYPEMVRLLLTHGANPDIPGWMQQTARLRARNNRHPEGAQIRVLMEQFQAVRPSPDKKR